MPRNLPLKDHARETRLFNARAILAGVVVVTVLLAVIARLVYLQVLSHEHYKTLSNENRVKLVPVPPTRGLIFDRNGLLLAENISAFTLEVTPEQVADLDTALAELRQLIEISDEDVDHFKRLVRQRRPFDSIPLRFRMTEEEVARFAVNRHRFEGFDIHARPVRHYPLGPLTAHVVGYVGRIDENELRRVDASNYVATTHIGKTGIEKAYENVLHGTVGYQQVEVNAQGRTLRVLANNPPVPGHNLYLNLDMGLQTLADTALRPFNGAAVALTPESGEVIALVSKPSYDPNLFVNGIDAKTYKMLRTSGSQPLFNRALRGQYPPGSTVKPFIGLAGLESQLAGHKTYCPGWYMLKGDDHKYRDWKKEGHGTTDLSKAIVQSCDVYFYELAHSLRIDRLHEFMVKFGFGHRTGIDLGGELSGLFPSREWKNRARNEPWYPGETVITGIGQGFTLATPLQLAAATATLANRGIRMKPTIVSAVQSADDEHQLLIDSEPLAPVVLKESSHWDYVHNAMVQVVHGKRGTARASGSGAPYDIAGKTGTAQVFGIKQDEEYDAEEVAAKLRDHSLFIAFAPSEQPRIAVAVVAENAGSGSAVAAPIARKLMDYYLLGVAP